MAKWHIYVKLLVENDKSELHVMQEAKEKTICISIILQQHMSKAKQIFNLLSLFLFCFIILEQVISNDDAGFI